MLGASQRPAWVFGLFSNSHLQIPFGQRLSGSADPGEMSAAEMCPSSIGRESKSGRAARGRYKKNELRELLKQEIFERERKASQKLKPGNLDMAISQQMGMKTGAETDRQNNSRPPQLQSRRRTRKCNKNQEALHYGSLLLSSFHLLLLSDGVKDDKPSIKLPPYLQEQLAAELGTALLHCSPHCIPRPGTVFTAFTAGCRSERAKSKSACQPFFWKRRNDSIHNPQYLALDGGL